MNENNKFYGTVTLDEESLNKLREQIREEVVAEIKDKGFMYDELEKWLLSQNHYDYYSLIKDSINHIVRKDMSIDDIFGQKNINRFKMLCTFRDLIENFG